MAVPSRVPALDGDKSCTCKSQILELHCESMGQGRRYSEKRERERTRERERE